MAEVADEGFMAKMVAKYVAWKVEYDFKNKLKLEKDKNEPMWKKQALGGAGGAAFTYSSVMLGLFIAHYVAAYKATDKNEYLCVNEPLQNYRPDDDNQENYADTWKRWMVVGIVNFLILCGCAIVTIIAAYVPAARPHATVVGIIGTVFHLITLIGLSLVRFSPDGQFCAIAELEPVPIVSEGARVNAANFFIELNEVKPVNVAQAFVKKNYVQNKKVDVARIYNEVNYPSKQIDVAAAYQEVNYPTSKANVALSFDSVNF